jgi:ABC-type nitrate/sulfonate/bicarbonate transport system substrate-binding protein
MSRIQWISRRLATTAIAVALPTLGVTACGGGSTGGGAGGNAGSGGQTTLRFQTFPNIMANLPVTVAQDHGFFAKNGLKVNVTPAAAGPAMVAALAAGKVDAVGIPMFLGLQSIKAGAKIKALVGLTGGGGSVMFVSKRVPATGAPYPASAEVLNGRTLAISAPGGFTDRMLRYSLGRAGVSAKYQTIPGVQPEIAAMRAGRIDLVNFDLVSSYKIQKQGLGRILWDFQTTGPTEFRGTSGTIAWVSDRFLHGNPAAAKAFARSIAEADAWLKDPKNRVSAKKYFSTLAGTEVADGDLDPMIDAMKPAVGARDVAAYARLLPAGATPPASQVLAPQAPQDDAAIAQLGGVS